MNDEDVFFLTGSFALKSVQPAHEPTANGVALGKPTFDMLYFCLFL